MEVILSCKSAIHLLIIGLSCEIIRRKPSWYEPWLKSTAAPDWQYCTDSHGTWKSAKRLAGVWSQSTMIAWISSALKQDVVRIHTKSWQKKMMKSHEIPSRIVKLPLRTVLVKQDFDELGWHLNKIDRTQRDHGVGVSWKMWGITATNKGLVRATTMQAEFLCDARSTA